MANPACNFKSRTHASKCGRRVADDVSRRCTALLKSFIMWLWKRILACGPPRFMHSRLGLVPALSNGVRAVVLTATRLGLIYIEIVSVSLYGWPSLTPRTTASSMVNGSPWIIGRAPAGNVGPCRDARNRVGPSVGTVFGSNRSEVLRLLFLHHKNNCKKKKISWNIVHAVRLKTLLS